MADEKKYGSGGRKQFVRTRVPLAETISGAVILVLLVVIGVAVYHKGKVYDPNLYAVRPDSLKGTAAPVEGKNVTAPSTPPATEAKSVSTETPQSTAPSSENSPPAGEGAGEGGGGGEGSPATAATPKPVIKNEPLEISLPGTKPMSDTEFYNSDN